MQVNTKVFVYTHPNFLKYWQVTTQFFSKIILDKTFKCNRLLNVNEAKMAIIWVDKVDF